MNTKQIRVDVPWYIHRDLKCRAARDRTTIKDLVIAAVEELLQKPDSNELTAEER